MKTIGFIDIHPQSPLCGPRISSPGEGPFGDEKSLVYVFTDRGGGPVCEETLDFASLEERGDIDEFTVSLPASCLDFRILNFPFSDKEKIAEVLPLELHNLIISGRDEIVFDSIVLARNEMSVEVLAVYIGKPVLSRILENLALRNIDPSVFTSLDLRPPAGIGDDSTRENYLRSLTCPASAPAEGAEARRIEVAGQEISEPTINLRRGQFAYTKNAAKTEKALRMAVVLAFLVALIVHANILFQSLMIKKESAAVTEQMRVSYRSLFPDEKRTIDELYQIKSHIKESKEIGNLLSGVAPLRLLLGLSRRMESNVVYTEIYVEKGLIKMKAEARSMDDLTKIRDKLSGFLTDVSISDIKPAVQGKILFTVVAKDQV